MRILVIILGAFLCLPALGQKKRVNDAIYVGQGIEINLHPYPYLQHKFSGTAPKDALEFDPAPPGCPLHHDRARRHSHGRVDGRCDLQPVRALHHHRQGGTAVERGCPGDFLSHHPGAGW